MKDLPCSIIDDGNTHKKICKAKPVNLHLFEHKVFSLQTRKQWKLVESTLLLNRNLENETQRSSEELGHCKHLEYKFTVHVPNT